MPGRDRMGPMGRGPMTGRGMGWCGGAEPLWDGPPGARAPGRAGGGGRGGGWRHRYWYYASGLPGWQRAPAGWPGLGAERSPSPAPADRLAAMRGRAERLEQELGEVKTWIREMGSHPAGGTGEGAR